jgi:transcriptional regulator with XRE-family HTH domain
MTQKRISDSLPADTSGSIIKLGERIMIARKRRRLSSEEMAKRMFVSRKTLFRLEKGDPGISLGVFASALLVLGLDKDLLLIADPERDNVGIFHERQQLSKRIRKKSTDNKLDF